jgi:site-specific recombinase XerD
MFTLSQILEGYELHAQARMLSPRTLEDYRHTFHKLAAFLDGDPPFSEIDKDQVESFLAAQTVGRKTLLNYHTGLSALWTWAYAQGFAREHILRQIERPNPGRRTIQPFSEADIRLLLSAAAASRAHQDRNRAIILLMLDTGLRAEELCEALIQDADLKNRSLHVFGKGDHERFVPFSPRTAQSLWKYLAGRKGASQADPLFLTSNGTPLDRHRLCKQIASLARRAGVQDAHPHRFRHTFAIFYLRNGGDPYTLQIILGHSTMEMVKKYLALARSDLAAAHRIASPVANMRL